MSCFHIAQNRGHKNKQASKHPWKACSYVNMMATHRVVKADEMALLDMLKTQFNLPSHWHLMKCTAQHSSAQYNTKQHKQGSICSRS